MRAQIIQIGNSQGIRLPKMLLEESGMSGDVELELHADGILIRNLNQVRAGWSDAFKKMSENDDDDVDDKMIETHFDKHEWQW